MRYFNFFSNILFTKGVNRVLISDLQRNNSELCPIELMDIIELLKEKSIEETFSEYNKEEWGILQDYLDFLLEREYGFITENDWNKNFPPMSMTYHDYSKISDIFIEIDRDYSNVEKLVNFVEKADVKYLVVFSYVILKEEDIIKIDRLFETSVLQGIEIYAPFFKEMNSEMMFRLNNNTNRIYNLVFYNALKPFMDIKDLRFNITFIEEKLSINSCGKVDIKYFNTNLSKITEAFNHNSCLHKKIGIDIHGNIKNCPSMPQSFGNIHEVSLEEALQHPDFKKYWNITKDSVAVCKDCEFRYVCTDCRAYTERTHFTEDGLDISKPLKCGYNPYTGEWEEWSTNPLKQKAIEYYGMRNFIKK